MASSKHDLPVHCNHEFLWISKEGNDMTRPDTLYEAASYDLNKFRERRMAERRATPRGTQDRRHHHTENQAAQEKQDNEMTPQRNDPA
jgi:hypothetical protein